MAGSAPNDMAAATPSPTASRTTPQLTFASVAAMAPKGSDARKVTKTESKSAEPREPKRSPPKTDSKQAISAGDEASDSLTRLRISRPATASAGNLDQEPSRRLPIDPRLDDEKTQLSVSSTKAPSLDGKSVASGTTFAMDEKESIRPDDSASVQAGEDDDSNSGPASGEPSSRFGSDSGVKPFRDQFNEISERAHANGIYRPLPSGRRPMIGAAGAIPRTGVPTPVLEHQALARPESITDGASVPVVAAGQTSGPDEKLLEALESSRDRMFLLHLEQQFITFIRDSKETILDLPPCNSFCRLLAHRLGDYYRLSHFVDNSVSSVRLHRNPNTYLPTPLSSIAPLRPVSEDTSLTQPSIKIIRRVESGVAQATESGNNTTASSIAPSGATSDAGDDSPKASGLASPTESTTTKEKAPQSREEREAKYNEARQRIFAGFREGDHPDSSHANDASIGASRTSSVAGKRNKRNNKNIDDSFTTRSAYGPSFREHYAPVGTFEQAAGNMAPFVPQMQPSNPPMMQPGYYMQYNQPYQHGPQMQPYQVPMQPSAPMPGPNGMYPSAQQQQQYMSFNMPHQQMVGQFYHPMQHQPQMSPQASNVSSPLLGNAAMAGPQPQSFDPSWGQASYPNQVQGYNGMPSTFQPQMQMSMPNNAMGNMSMPYPYGQLPVSPDSNNARNAHPLPGSFNRQNLNPQTRSFVPGAGLDPTPGTDAAYRMGASPSAPGPTGFAPAASYPAAAASYPPVQGTANPTPHRKHNHRNHGNASTPAQSPPQSSTLSKWGTPATLPPKPPPPASPHASSNGSALGGAGQAVFSNGTYSQAGPSPPGAKAP